MFDTGVRSLDKNDSMANSNDGWLMVLTTSILKMCIKNSNDIDDYLFKLLMISDHSRKHSLCKRCISTAFEVQIGVIS